MTHAADHDLDLAAIARSAVEAAGGSSKLGRDLNLSKSTVHSWTGTRIPADWMPKVSAATGIPMRDLRPDLWPAPEVSA